MKTIQEAINHCRERSANARSKECQCDHLELLGWLEELIVLRAEVARLAGEVEVYRRAMKRARGHFIRIRLETGTFNMDDRQIIETWLSEIRAELAREKGEKGK